MLWVRWVAVCKVSVSVVAAVVVIVHFHFSANCFQMQLDCNASLAMQCVVQNFHNGAFEITTLHAQWSCNCLHSTNTQVHRNTSSEILTHTKNTTLYMHSAPNAMGLHLVKLQLPPLHNYRNIQIHKYTKTQIHKYTNTQIHKYINT